MRERSATGRGLVAAVTEDDAIADYDARKAALRAQMAAAGVEAHAVYAADKIAKVRELRAQVAATAAVRIGVSPAAGPLRAEPRAAAQVAPGLPMVDQLAFELWALRVLPPAR